MADAARVIDHGMVLKLASAAHIDLAREEVERIALQLTDILSQIAPIADMVAADEARTHASPAPSAPADAPLLPSEAQPLRADVTGADVLHGTLSRFAPEMREGFFTVPLLPTHSGAGGSAQGGAGAAGPPRGPAKA
jgi:Asp-tRNA(Asn)/Glu-tRNA(Gln) amidotransferase C subunit